MALPSLLTTHSYPVPRMVLTLAASFLLGWVFSLLHVPLPWMLGPLAATGFMSGFGAELRVPPYGRQLGQGIVGIVIGLNLTHEVAVNLITNIPYIVIMSLLGIAIGVIIAVGVARASQVPFRTSFFACMPGGVIEMAVLAEKHGGDLGYIALAHSIRVVAVVSIVAPAISFLSDDVGGVARSVSLDIPVDWARFMGMLVVSVLIAVVLDYKKVSNAYFIGGLIIGGITAYYALPLSSAPGFMINLAQVLIGSALGLRLRRDSMAGLKSWVGVMVGSTAALIGGMLVVAWGLMLLMDQSFFTMVLATAPGGLAEMSITASVFNLGLTTVAAFHCVRIVLVMLLSGPIFMALEKAGLVPVRHL